MICYTDVQQYKRTCLQRNMLGTVSLTWSNMTSKTIDVSEPMPSHLT